MFAYYLFIHSFDLSAVYSTIYYFSLLMTESRDSALKYSTTCLSLNFFIIPHIFRSNNLLVISLYICLHSLSCVPPDKKFIYLKFLKQIVIHINNLLFQKISPSFEIKTNNAIFSYLFMTLKM